MKSVLICVQGQDAFQFGLPSPLLVFLATRILLAVAQQGAYRDLIAVALHAVALVLLYLDSARDGQGSARMIMAHTSLCAALGSSPLSLADSSES